MATVSGRVSEPQQAATPRAMSNARWFQDIYAASSQSSVASRHANWWRTDQTRWIHKEFLFVDLLCVVLSSCAAVYAQVVLARIRDGSTLSAASGNMQLALLFLMGVFVSLFCLNYGIYRARRTRRFEDEVKAIAKSMLLSSVLLAGFVLLADVHPVLWGTMFVALSLQFWTMVGWRYHEFRRTEHGMTEGVGTRHVLIVGAGELGEHVAESLGRERHLGYVVKGFLDDSPHNGNPNILGRVEDLAHLARAHFVDEIVIALPWESEAAAKATIEARRHRLNVKLVPDFYSRVPVLPALDYVGDIPAFCLHREPIPAIALFIKRAIDVALSSAGIVLLTPFFVLLAFMIKLDSPGPIFYRSYRVGKKGCRFLFYKLRTMVANADELKITLRTMNERRGPFFKMSKDPRLTRVGRYLRRYSIDELPQLWNVLKGDMSLVGPRPHPLDDYQHYSLDNLRRLDVMPGVTGLWQVEARHDPSWDTNMRLDLEYIEHWTPFLDFKILLKTIPIVLKGLGQ